MSRALRESVGRERSDPRAWKFIAKVWWISISIGNWAIAHFLHSALPDCGETAPEKRLAHLRTLQKQSLEQFTVLAEC
ncbi:MAG: hypothetical protein D6680_10575 [Cyanobacteria bacterium J007]|nr:MAG: hypothetical protein D6680_10575 [Cyanobacteria bacterium J007]